MTGLINLVLDNLSHLIVLPILSIIIIVLTIFLSKNSERSIIKYYPAMILGIVAIVFAIFALINFTRSIGLNVAWISIMLATCALVGFFTGIITSIADTLNIDNK